VFAILHVLISTFAVLLVLPLGIFVVFSNKERARGALVVAVCLAWVGGCSVRAHVGPNDSEGTLNRTIRHANRVVTAIESFERDSARAPASITALVPGYLSESDLPRGGTTLRYSSHTSQSQIWFTWDYNLVPHARSPKSRSGPILLLDFSGAGLVRDVDVLFSDNCGPVPPVEFDSTRWALQDSLRIGMAFGIRKSRLLIGHDTTEVVRWLGTPSNRRARYPGNWFLAVASPTSFDLDYNALILDSPTVPYSDAGDSVRMGRWWVCRGCYERIPDPEPESTQAQ